MCMNPLTKKLMTRNTKKLPESDSSDTEGFGSPPSPTLSPPAFQILSSSKIPGADQGKSTDTPMKSHTNQNRTGQIKRQGKPIIAI